MEGIQKIVFVVSVESFGHDDDDHQLRVAQAAGKALHHAFGDRVTIWAGARARKVIFDPLAKDGSQATFDDSLTTLMDDITEEGARLRKAVMAEANMDEEEANEFLNQMNRRGWGWVSDAELIALTEQAG